MFDEDLHFLYEDIAALVAAGNQVVLVHGGGPQINAILEKTGYEPKYINSASGVQSRLTDETTLDAAIMALGGIINKKIVAAMITHGINAFGFTGVDGSCMVASRKEQIISVDPVSGKRFVIKNDYSGKIDASLVKGDVVLAIMNAGLVPVIGALAIDEKGQILNIDGDRAAACVCKAIDGQVFISATDVPGILKDMESKELIAVVPAVDLDSILDHVGGGMKKKIIAVKEAVSLGIPEILITSGLVEGGLSHALDGTAGTRIALD